MLLFLKRTCVNSVPHASLAFKLLWSSSQKVWRNYPKHFSLRCKESSRAHLVECDWEWWMIMSEWKSKLSSSVGTNWNVFGNVFAPRFCCSCCCYDCEALSSSLQLFSLFVAIFHPIFCRNDDLLRMFLARISDSSMSGSGSRREALCKRQNNNRILFLEYFSAFMAEWS